MKRIILLLISIYKTLISPTLVILFGHGCRFTPTCSEYAYESINRYGILKGTLLSLKRVSKCHPFATPYIEEVKGRI